MHGGPVPASDLAARGRSEHAPDGSNDRKSEVDRSSTPAGFTGRDSAIVRVRYATVRRAVGDRQLQINRLSDGDLQRVGCGVGHERYNFRERKALVRFFNPVAGGVKVPEADGLPLTDLGCINVVVNRLVSICGGRLRFARYYADQNQHDCYESEYVLDWLNY
jgi:hypothetical protein